MTNHCSGPFVSVPFSFNIILIWNQIVTFHHHVPFVEDSRNVICFLTLNDKMEIGVYVLGHGFYYETYSKEGFRLILVYETRTINIT